MNKLLLIVSAICILSGCAAGSNFKPKTVEGASCKVQCGKDMATCNGSSYTCDRAAATCMAGCQDLDNIKSKD